LTDIPARGTVFGKIERGLIEMPDCLCDHVPENLPIFATPVFFQQTVTLHLWLLASSESREQAEVHWSASEYYNGLYAMSYNMPVPSLKVMVTILNKSIIGLSKKVREFNLGD
jgi:hypothetical protein